MSDIYFINNIDSTGNFDVVLDGNPQMVSGNQLLANIVETVMLTNVQTSLLSNGFGGDATNLIGKSYNPNDLASISAMMKVSLDKTKKIIIDDQNESLDFIPATEKLFSLDLVDITKIADRIMVTIKVVPQEMEPRFAPAGPTITLPL